MKQNKGVYLDIAKKIGYHLCSTSYVSGNRCNWIGKSTEESLSSMLIRISAKALGADVYEGTSGIAFFLAYLSTICREIDGFYITSFRGMNQALSRIESISNPTAFGFYTGKVGVCYAATKVGRMLNEESLCEKALGILLNRCEIESTAEHYIDLMSGNAGAIPALLDLSKEFDEPKFKIWAQALADELISLATKDSTGWSWDPKLSGLSDTQRNLTGISHGTAGFAYGLLELFNGTNDSRYLHASECAFDYENHWYSSEYGNWPDFRSTAIMGGVQSSNRIYSNGWCHGAPGIALSRLRAYEILKDQIHLKYALVGLSTAKKRINEAGNNFTTGDNFSLCHGLAGISELMIYASEVTNDTSYKVVAERIADLGVDSYGRDVRLWPCGTQYGQTPGLMVGLAGIGNFYLDMILENKRKERSTLLLPFN